MRRSRSKLNNLSSNSLAQNPLHQGGGAIGANRQTDEIQKRLGALGVQHQPMMPEMYPASSGMAGQAHPAHPMQHSTGMGQSYPAPQHPYDDPYQGHVQQQPQAFSNQEPQSVSPHYMEPDTGYDQVRASLESMSSKLSALQNNDSANAHTEALVRQNQQITAELLEMRKILAKPNAPDNSGVRAEMEAIRHAVETNYHAIAQQLAGAGDSSVSTDDFAIVMETSHEKLTNQLQNMHSAIDSISGNSDIVSKTLEARHDEIANRIAHLQETINAASVNPELYSKTVEDSHHVLLAQFEELKTSMSTLETSSANTQPDLTNVEMRLEEITRALVALSAGNQSVDSLDRIEARIGSLSKSISEISTGSDTSSLGRIEQEISSLKSELAKPVEVSMDTSPFEEQMKSVRETLNELNTKVANTQNAPAEGFAHIAKQISSLSEKIENRSVVSQGDAGDSNASELVSRLDELVARVEGIKSLSIDLTPVGEMINNGPSKDLIEKFDHMAATLNSLSLNKPTVTESVDHSAKFEALEGQLNEIMSHLGNQSTVSEFSLDPVTERLGGIEQQISASRDIAIEVASQAAQEAVQRTVQEMPTDSGSQGVDAINNLAGDIQRWHDSVSTASAENFETFDAVKDSLSIMAERLSHIEDTIRTGQTYKFGPTGETGMHVDYAQPAQDQQYEPVPAPNPVDVLGAVFKTEISNHEGQDLEPEDLSSQGDVKERAIEERAIEAQAKHGSDHDDYTHDNHEAPEARTLVHAEDLPSSSMSSDHISADAIEMEPQGSADNNNPLFQAAVDEVQRQQSPSVEGSAFQDHASEEVLDEQLPIVENPAMDMTDLPETSEFETQQAEDDMPLEPGTGAPDLAALVKQANEMRKSNAKNGVVASGSDFLASARRAAQAAAQEANIAQEEMEREQEKNGKSGGSSFLKNIFARRKKVILIGAAAVLIAALAIPLVGLVSSLNDVQVSNNSVTVIEESVEEEEVLESVFGGEPSQEDTAQNFPEESEVITPEDADTVTVNSTVVSESPVSLSDVQPNDVDATPEFEADDTVSQDAVEFDASQLSFVNDALLLAVSNNDPKAMHEVARRYAEGLGTDKNLEQAAFWYERAAERGLAPAQYIIGNLNEKGIGTDKNIAKAVSWYQLAAENGNVVAKHNLGVLHATPNLIAAEPDMASAFKWFGEAAEYGVRDSQVNLGIFYTRGMGVDVDLISAYKWFTIAAAGGDKDALSKLDFVKQSLRPDQLESAKAIAASWTPNPPNTQANDVVTPANWAPEEKPKPIAQVSKKTIAQMQTVLTGLGYKPGTADGVMGDKTRDAIAQYQKNAGLQITGSVNAELLRALSKDISG